MAMIAKRKKEMLLFFFRDRNKKNWSDMIGEFLSLYKLQKKLPTHYINLLLYRKDVTNCEDYLSTEENNKLLSWSYAHAKEEIVLCEDKLLFEELLVKNKIPTPQIFFHNSKNKFTYGDAVSEIRTKKDFFSFLEKVFNEKNVQQLFCKPIDGGQGRNIFILDKKSFRDTTDALVDLVLSQSFLFQEVIEQHESLKKINSCSVNSIRIVTNKNKENKVEVLSAVIRLGRSGSIVDNAHAGGVVVAINKETGKMCDQGLQLLDNGGGVYYKHPDTGIVFKDYKIPYFEEAKDIVTKASSLLKFPLLGWDVAITPNGPVIIEVNHDFYLRLSDRMEKGLKNNPTFNKLIDDLK